jgi:hypothetical protein
MDKTLRRRGLKAILLRKRAFLARCGNQSPFLSSTVTGLLSGNILLLKWLSYPEFLTSKRSALR